MADEDTAQDVVQEITPEQFDGEEVAATNAESSPAEEKTATEVKTDEQPKEEAQGDDTPAEPKDAEQVEETETDSPKAEEPETDKPQTKAEERKAQLNTEIRDLVAQRNALKREVEQRTGEVYKPASETDLMEETNPDTGEKYTNLEAKLEAYRQEQEISKYNEQVADAQLSIGTESMRVLNDFPIFNPESDSYEPELASEAAALLEANLIRDDDVPEIGEDGKPTGQGIIIGSRISPYSLYQTLARASGISATKGQLKGQQAREEMLANADAPPTVAPPKEKKDPVIALWEADD